MRTLFLLPLIFFACNQSTRSAETIVEGLVDLPASAKKEPYADNPDLVRVTIETSPGIPLEQGDYLNGKKHGTWTTYHSNEIVAHRYKYFGCSTKLMPLCLSSSDKMLLFVEPTLVTLY